MQQFLGSKIYMILIKVFLSFLVALKSKKFPSNILLIIFFQSDLPPNLLIFKRNLKIMGNSSCCVSSDACKRHPDYYIDDQPHSGFTNKSLQPPVNRLRSSENGSFASPNYSLMNQSYLKVLKRGTSSAKTNITTSRTHEKSFEQYSQVDLEEFRKITGHNIVREEDLFRAVPHANRDKFDFDNSQTEQPGWNGFESIQKNMEQDRNHSQSSKHKEDIYNDLDYQVLSAIFEHKCM